jgi:pimeloyl-ACP methyl ester carboxylesterase
MSTHTSRFEFSCVETDIESEGLQCAGRLYRPDRPRRPPVVVAGPGAGLPASAAVEAYAERLAASGRAVLTFDYRGVGGSEGSGVVDPERRLADWRAAVEHVRGRDRLDGDRPALLGVGLGGGLALAVAGTDSRIGAVVAHDPLLDGAAVLGGRPVRDRVRALGSAARDSLGAPLGRGRDVPLLDASDGRALFVGGDAAALAALGPPGWRNAAPARSHLRLREFGVDLDPVSAPTLLVSARESDLVTRGSVATAADRLPGATHLELPDGHDVFYREPERIAAHDIAFLE